LFCSMLYNQFKNVLISFKGVNGNPFALFLFTGTIVGFHDKKLLDSINYLYAIKGDLDEEIIKYCVVNNIDIIIVEHEIHC